MTIIGDAYIAVKGDTKGFSPSVEKGVLSSVGSLAKKAALIFGGAFVGREIFKGLKDSLAEGADATKVLQDVQQTVKSTGGAANFTADQMDKLATAISVKTGIDDEAILSAEGMLATFTNLRNEAGKGNDVFTQAAKIATDMGVKFKNGPEAASIQLGKALNDPVKGITALTRVGVTFDEQQRKQIQTMVESGNRLGAQKVILAELTKEFGGQAEAQANAVDKIKVAFSNLQESLGQAIAPAIEAILPAVMSVADALGEVMKELGTSVGRVVSALAPALGTLADALVPIVQGIAKAVEAIAPLIGQAVQSLVPLLEPVMNILTSVVQAAAPLLPMIARIAGELGGAFLQVLAAVLDAFRPLVPVIQEVAQALTGSLSYVIEALVPVILQLVKAFKPVMPVVAELAKLIGLQLGKVIRLLVPVITEMADTFGSVLAQVLPPVAKAILSIVKAIAPLLTPQLIKTLLTLASPFFFLLQVLEPVLPVIGKVVGVLGDVVATLAKSLQPILPPIMDAIEQLVSALGDGLAQVLEALLPALPPLAEALGAILQALLPLLVPLLQLVTLVLEKIGVPVLVLIATAIAKVAEALAGIITWVSKLVQSLEKMSWEEFKGHALDAVHAVGRFFGELPERLGAAARRAVEFIGSHLDDVLLLIPRLQIRLARAVPGIFGALVDAAKNVLPLIMDQLGKMPGRILDLQAAIGRSALKVGAAIIDGMGKGLSKTTEFVGKIAGAVKRALVGLINDLVDLLNDGIPDKLGWGRLAIDIPNDPIPRIKLAGGGIIGARPGGVDVTAAEAGVDEAFLPLLPGVLEGLKAIAAGQAPGSGLQVNVDRIEMRPNGDPLQHAVDFVDGIGMAAWMAGIGT